MAEIASKVYDIVYPSPIRLEELASIAVAIDLWRINLNEICDFPSNPGDFQSFQCSKIKPKTILESIRPKLPLPIRKMIKKYMKALLNSTYNWLQDNYRWIFLYHRVDRQSIVKDFDDIVCDYDGSIHYARTAKRMLLCDRISEDEKFKIACAYSFEEDIRRIGQSVQSKVNLEEIKLGCSVALYYWVLLLRNELDKIPNDGFFHLENLLFANVESTSAFEYFCKLTEGSSEDSWLEFMCYESGFPLLMGTRFVLPKLSEDQLDTFIDEDAVDILISSDASDEIKRAIWKYIKDKMSEDVFLNLINGIMGKYEYYICSRDKSMSAYCEIWTSASDKLKQYAIEYLLSNEDLFEENLTYYHTSGDKPADMSFLLTVLYDLSLEEKNTFWCNNWINILFTAHITDVDQIMKLCFANDDEISQFKRNTMAKYENIAEMKALFCNNYYKQFSDVVNFIYSEDEQSSRDLKQKCLQQCFPRKSRIDLKSFHKFIDEAFGELASKFRNHFFSIPHIECQLLNFVRKGGFSDVSNFVDSFASHGSNVESFKERIADELKKFLIGGSNWGFEVDELRTFLLWCLGSDDRVAKFKQSISPVCVLSNMCMMDEEVEKYQEIVAIEKVLLRLEDFLLWYFDTQEEMNEFKAKYANIFKILAMQSSKFRND